MPAKETKETQSAGWGGVGWVSSWTSLVSFYLYIHLGTNVLWFMNDLLCDDDNVLRYDGGVETRWRGVTS